MDIVKIINDFATGSVKATPTTGSAGVDYLAGIPAALLRLAAGFVDAISS